MDGYAYSATGVQDGAELDLIGESLAGHPFSGTISTGQCVRITTGAAVPDSADTVVIQENTIRSGDRVKLTKAADPGQNIRAIGHDIPAGAEIITAGKRLNPFDIGWLAACGIDRVAVSRTPRVAIFSTGDELMVPGEALGAGQIYDANRYALAAMLESLPVTVTDLGILSDDRQSIEDALRDAAQAQDLLMTSGGVSVGDADYVREIVEALGRIDLWRLNLKPGKPLAFGSIGRALFLGLPGNPVSTIVTYLLVAQPLILKLAGARPSAPGVHPARLSEGISHAPGREEYQRGMLHLLDGQLLVQVSGDQSSNRLATFSNADCLIRIPKESGDLPVGAEVEVLPFFGLLR
jgi:molybdopterin molybdotransferase